MEGKIITDIVQNLKVFKLLKFTFLEDGYELYLTSSSKDALEIISNIEIDGFIAIDCTKEGKFYRLVLVPESIEKMTEYIWDYVEKYCDKYVPEDKSCYNLNIMEEMADLCGAFSALETAIEQIPAEKRKKALDNYSEFSKMLF